jgi:beta-glucanase (GH16 family)
VAEFFNFPFVTQSIFMKTYLSLFFSVLILAGCGGGGSDEPEVIPPTNLVIQVEEEAGNTGKVTVTASAENATYYQVSFGHNTPDTSFPMTNGVASYTYPVSGTYTIKVTAFANSNVSIQGSEEVEVTRVYTGPTSPESYDGMTLVWQDEFNGNALDPSDWTFEIGTGSNGWGNNELEYYRAENTSFKDGNLIITAKNDGFSGSAYTSSRIVTKDKMTFKFGRVDIRAILPQGQGIWPALWTLGNNISEAGVGWPKCGEIDIMEMIGGSGREKTVHGTLHWYDVSGYASSTGHKDLASGIYSDQYHVFSIVWNADEIVWYVDDVEFKRIDISPLDTPERFDEFRLEHFLIFNVAVGGNWPQAPNASTQFPQRMIVDYVRIFQPI